jgi:hypothetical protein
VIIRERNEALESLQATTKLNRDCECITLDRAALLQGLAYQLGDTAGEFLASPPWGHFFSDTAVFLPRQDLVTMQAVVRALESASLLPEYRQKVLSWAPETAQVSHGPVGAFMGYDFHLGEAGPRLIEINTNAGGAFLNAQLARAQKRCCNRDVNASWIEGFDAAVIRQFEAEWRAQRGGGRPSRIAIIDDQPMGQYLYPEFRLAQQLFQRQGIDAVILSPAELRYEAGALYGNGLPVDMVYNRLVDFALDLPEHAALRKAWMEGGAVITPNPFAHGLLADKRNLTVLSDRTVLEQWGLNPEDAMTLEKAVPRTVPVSDENASSLWSQRRELFFKPVAGHGSKGVYRGSKLTKGTFASILESDYIAQTYVPPSERAVVTDGESQLLKVDVRLYTYRGEVIMAAARLYQGQTTNFRTPGGGFAPLFVTGSA